MRLIDTSHPFYRPAWRRYLLVAIPFVWSGVEWSIGSMIWAWLTAAVGGVMAWHLILNWREPEDD
ncbi:MAG: hypothetical protein JJU09_02170 [Rhodobacteraceae bacterium]|nr:hypothetical protein [Paracoccaceae bacterium]TVR47160.1 MAG: hypothetical protein EA386_08375 [Paracoccaceae bacterium]